MPPSATKRTAGSKLELIILAITLEVLAANSLGFITTLLPAARAITAGKIDNWYG